MQERVQEMYFARVKKEICAGIVIQEFQNQTPITFSINVIGKVAFQKQFMLLMLMIRIDVCSSASGT